MILNLILYYTSHEIYKRNHKKYIIFGKCFILILKGYFTSDFVSVYSNLSTY